MANFTQAQLTAARDNFARGVKVIQKGDERVEFRTLDEMRQVIAEMERDLGPKVASRQLKPSYSRGT